MFSGQCVLCAARFTGCVGAAVFHWLAGGERLMTTIIR
jgi:hypothetical protein